MIDEVVISNFKGIRQCTIENLGRVNLFIGKNDSGKSSVMEAIYATTKEYLGGPGLAESIRRKTDRGKSGRALWYGYDPTSPIQITLKLGANTLTTMFRCDKEGVQSILTQESPEKWKTEASRYELRNLGCKVMGNRMPPRGPDSTDLMSYFDNTVFLDCSMKAAMEALEGAYLNRIKLSGKGQDFADLFASTYNKEKSWEFIPHPDFVKAPSRVTINEHGRSIFVDDLGDGPRYGVAICATAMALRDTGIFIEEIESHQHPGALKILTKKLVELSRTNNLQLFITTHSFDAWRAFHHGAYDDPEKRKVEFRSFYVERSPDGVVSATIKEDLPTIMKIFETETPPSKKT